MRPANGDIKPTARGRQRLRWWVLAEVAVFVALLGCFSEEEQLLALSSPPAAPAAREAKAGAAKAARQAEGTPACRFPGPWTRSPQGPLRTATGDNLSRSNILGDPYVVREADRFRMWFTARDSTNRMGTAYAESQDGVVWQVWKKSSSPDTMVDLVVGPSSTGWDAVGIETVSTLRTPSGEYRMYYTGNRPPEGSHTFAIGLATSPDGLTWTKVGDRPIFETENDWEKPTCKNPNDPRTCEIGGPLEPTVLYDSKEKLYKMWYAAVGKRKGVLAFRIGYATSADGLAWTRRSDPVLDTGGPGAWDELEVSHAHVVPDPSFGYHLFYFGDRAADYCEGCVMQRGSIGHAFSPDGVTWQRNPANPILSPRPGQWDGWTVAGPSALIHGKTFWLWYFSNDKADSLRFRIGPATAPCPG